MKFDLYSNTTVQGFQFGLGERIDVQQITNLTPTVFTFMDKMGYDFCYNPNKFYLKIDHFRGICVDYCPYLFYVPSY